MLRQLKVATVIAFQWHYVHLSKKKRICTYLSHIQKDYIINMDYVRLSTSSILESWTILDNIEPWHNFSITWQFGVHPLTISWQFSSISSVSYHFLADAQIFSATFIANSNHILTIPDNFLTISWSSWNIFWPYPGSFWHFLTILDHFLTILDHFLIILDHPDHFW